MAIAFDAAGNGGQTSGSPASISFSHTCTGSNRALVVAAKMDGATPSLYSAPTVTYAGVSMTQVTNYAGDSVTGRVTTFVLANPASGANNVVITQGATKGTFLSGVSASYTGVGQVTPTDTNNNSVNAATGTLTATASTVANNDWGIYCVGGEGTVTASTNSTQRASNSVITFKIFDTNADQAVGSVSMSVTISSNTNGSMFFLIPFGAAVAISQLTALNCG